MHSFPGGHAANIMSCASFWSRRFQLSVAEPLLYLAALGVGWGRTFEGAHWSSDTFIGQAYGWSVGQGIAERYLRRNAPDHADLKAGVGIMIRIRL
jgi:membrane-associated phospholipid phosphatase